MLRFELKKVFSRTGNKIAVVLIVFVLALSSWLAVSEVYYENGQGGMEQGVAAARKLRNAKKEWAGELTIEKLKEIIQENARINATPEAQSQDVTQNNIAFSWKQGFIDIKYLFGYAAFQKWDYTRIDSLAPEAAENFYTDRVLYLKEYLEGDGADYFSDKEKAYLVRQFEKMEAPLRYDYTDGWEQFFQYSPVVIMITVLILGFLVTGIFSSESSLKADSIFYTAYHGRGKAVAAKVEAGFCIITGFYWLVIGIYTLIVLGLLGADGANSQIQCTMAGWKSFYNFTNLELYFFVAVGGYIGALAVLFAAMLVSAKTKSAVLAAAVPFVLIFLPEFVSGSGIDNALLPKIMGVFPMELMRIGMAVKYLNVYEIFGRVVDQISLDLMIYTPLAAAAVPALYFVFKKSEVR